MKEINEIKVRMIRCTVESCHKTFRSRYWLRKHMENDHLLFPRNGCSDCKKFSETRKSYTEHYGIHKSDGTRSCIVCQDYLSQIRNFAVHSKNNGVEEQESPELHHPKPVFNLMEMAIRKLMGK